MLAPRKKLHCTPASIIEDALDLLEVTSADVMLDVGCGDGRSLIAAAVRCGARGIGIEIEEERAALARANAEAAGVAHLVEIRTGNALEMDLSAATKVFLFLTDRGLRIMRPLLEAIPRQRAGADDKEDAPPLRVCTYLYRFAGVRPDAIKRCTQSAAGGAKAAETAYPLHLYALPLQPYAKASSSSSSSSSSRAQHFVGPVGLGWGAVVLATTLLRRWTR